MPSEPFHPGSAQRPRDGKVRVGRLAGKQRGRVSRAQLTALGITPSAIKWWIASGYLYPELPRVYAVGHPGRTAESDLFAALLYAGPGAALNGLAGSVWRGLVKWRTADAIEVCSPCRHRSLDADDPENGLGRPIVVHRRAKVRRAPYHGIPTVPIPQLVIELAATGDLSLVRFVLAQLDFMRILDAPALENECGRGVPGSAVLRAALGRPQPLLARARSPLEVRLIEVCEETGLPLPEINVKVAGLTVDALWREERVVVECDGEANHGSWRQRRHDAGNDMKLRGLGFAVIRYTAEQLEDPWAVHGDLTAALDARRRQAG